jgi:hypothetical protein
VQPPQQEPELRVHRDMSKPKVARIGIGERLAWWESSDAGDDRAAITESVDKAPRPMSGCG